MNLKLMIMNYKEVVEDLVEYLNNMIDDPMRNLHGAFFLEVSERRGVLATDGKFMLEQHLKLWFVDEERLLLLNRESVILDKEKEINKVYKGFYRELINHILFAKDTSKDDLKDNWGTPLVIIPIRKLMIEGLKINK
jgi:hypothetical protein